jgi:DNA-binding SARP family transcriptional activator
LLDEARAEASIAAELAPAFQQVEVSGELAELEFYYGDRQRAQIALDRAPSFAGEGRDQAILLQSLLDACRLGPEEAFATLDKLDPNLLRTSVAFESRRQAARAYIAWLSRDPQAETMARDAASHAAYQGAALWQQYASVLAAIASEATDPSDEVAKVGRRDSAIISMAAEVVCSRLGDLASDCLAIVEAEAGKRPYRWLPSLRAELSRPAAREGNLRQASRLIALIGERPDIGLLLEVGKSLRDPSIATLSKQLARRLAVPVDVLDLGRVRVSIGARIVDGSSVRRKVLALLCFLLTKPSFSASREDVTESLWPDLDPNDALNSLNQTVYFLRRVFEPAFREGLSPGYLHQDGETIWLDTDLVSSTSARCRALIDDGEADPSITDAASLLAIYEAPFALDFAYEEWASRYRDPLHASVLRVAEHAIRSATRNLLLQGAIGVAQRASRLEPEADEIQMALIQLYRMTGAHAAAAEQYEHYVESMTALGLEPQPLGEG